MSNIKIEKDEYWNGDRYITVKSNDMSATIAMKVTEMIHIEYDDVIYIIIVNGVNKRRYMYNVHSRRLLGW